MTSGALAGEPRPRGAAEVERLLRQRESLLQVIEEISSELEPRALLTGIVRHACDLLDAGDGAIGLYDEARDLIRIAAVWRMPESELGSEIPPGVGLAGQVLLTRRPVVLARYGQAARPLHPELTDNAVVGVPISWRERLVGFFGLGAPPPRRFDEDDVAVLELFARHAAIAIANARRYEEERRRNERLALIARIGRIIAADLELDELLQTAADAVHELLHYPSVDIPLLDPHDPATLVVRVRGGGYKRQIAGEDRLPVAQGVMGAAVRERRVQLVNDVTRDPRYVRPPGTSEARAELAVPILLGEAVLGVLNVESAEPFDEQDAASLQIVADHLSVAINNARLFERAQQAAVLEERQRLARDLHDSVTQMLTSLNMIGQTLAAAWRRDPAEGERRTERLAQLARSALAEMRALLKELRPAAPGPANASAEILIAGIGQLRRHGLAAGLQRLAAETPADAPPVGLELGGYQPQPAQLEEALFRVAQEALANALKHARARRIRIAAAVEEAAVVLRVRDDGAGFDPGAAAAAARCPGEGGLGLVSMRERLEALGGSLRIESAPGRGTTVEARLPRGPGR